VRTSDKKWKTDKESTYSKLKNVLFARYLQAQASGIPVDGTTVQQKSLKIAAGMESELDLLLQAIPRPGTLEIGHEDCCCGHQCHKRFQRLLDLLEGYEARNIYNAYETGLATCRVPCLEDMCDVVGSGNCMEEGQSDGDDDDNEAESEQVLSFMEALCAYVTMRAFMYAHDIIRRDQESIIINERSLSSLKRKGATKQLGINDLFKKK
jgi:hypothetical protein